MIKLEFKGLSALVTLDCVLESTVRVLAISASLQCQYNTTLPSSAVVKRLFSLGKGILKPKRCGLSDEHFEMLAFLKGN